MSLTWYNIAGVQPRSYVCGYCNDRVRPEKGWYTNQGHAINNVMKYDGYIYVCPCGKPTFFDVNGAQFPGAAFGNPVDSLPSGVKELYNDARNAVAVNAFTSAVLTCRKILMHVAVEKGAPAGQSFLEYVEYLASKGYVPPDGKVWVDHIRNKGNEANHQIVIMSPQDARDLVIFLEMLLKFVYEFPAKVALLNPGVGNPAPTP